MFSSSLDCLLTVESKDDVKRIGYYITYYGLLITIGTLVFIIILECLIYVGTKFI